MTQFLIISSDCHAGDLPETYNQYMPEEYREAARAWWIQYAREMIVRRGTFFDQEASEAYDEGAGGGAGKFNTAKMLPADLTDDVIRGMLEDGESAFAPRRGEWEAKVRLEELEADGVVGEVIFPQMVPFGASLLQYRGDDQPEPRHGGPRGTCHNIHTRTCSRNAAYMSYPRERTGQLASYARPVATHGNLHDAHPARSLDRSSERVDTGRHVAGPVGARRHSLAFARRTRAAPGARGPG